MDAFETFLQENKDKKMVTVTPGGNHGDTLIHLGLLKKLNEFNIDFLQRNLEKTYKKNKLIGLKYLTNIFLWKLGFSNGFKLLDIPEDVDLILFEGGGYINDIWYGPTLLKQIMKRNSQQIAIGPHSLKFTKTDFSSYFQDQRPVEIFCREKYSYLHLNKLEFPVNVKIKVSKDTAFYLEKIDLETGTLCEEYDLICFRTDKESALTSKQKKEVITGSEKPFIQDISIDGTFTEFINKVEKAKKIYTDRLHVAILGYIFEKDVTLYGNRYHKNRGVWEYCLKDQVNFEIQ